MQDNSTKKINTSGILARKAMLVTLDTSCWSARKKDKIATKEVTTSKAAADDAAIVYKALERKLEASQRSHWFHEKISRYCHLAMEQRRRQIIAQYQIQ